MALEVRLGEGDARAVALTRLGARALVTIDGRAHRAALHRDVDAGNERLEFDGRHEPMLTAVVGDEVWVHAFGRAWRLTVIDPVERAAAGGAADDTAVAPMPGTVVTVAVSAGESVGQGQQLVVIESMKMQSEIVALRDGVVERVFVAVGDTFDRGAPLVSLTALADEAGDATVEQH